MAYIIALLFSAARLVDLSTRDAAFTTVVDVVEVDDVCVNLPVDKNNHTNNYKVTSLTIMKQKHCFLTTIHNTSVH